MTIRITRTRANLNPIARAATVLVDGSALFLAAKVAGDGRQLDYRNIVQLVCENVEGLYPPGREPDGAPTTWVMWTSASAENAGQNRFLEFAEKELLWLHRVKCAN